MLFDVDGTLLLTGGAGSRALDRAFRALHGLDGAMRDVRPGGMTDPAIVREVFVARLGRGPSAAEMTALCDAYVPLLAEEVAASREFHVMPGVEELLARLGRRDDLLLGLVTGNLERAARIKLARPGLDRHFRFGGFGSDSESRDELTRIGVERGRRAAGAAGSQGAASADRGTHARRDGAARIVVVGDTPHDVRAARHVGAICVAVATGMTPYEALAAAEPDLLLRDLTDPAPLLAALD